MTTEKYTPQSGDYVKMPGNKQYLPVPARVQWFRGEHPDWSIITSVYNIDFDSGYAIMRAEVLDESGRIIASGMKAETRKGFGDFIEKAETGAVGRALARAGYGTEDALDLEGDRIADAPIGRPSQPERSRSAPQRPAPAQRTPEEQMLLDMLLAVPGMSRERMSLLADAVGVPKGERASADQLRQMLDLIEQPPESSPSEAVDGEPESRASGSPPSMDDILAAAGPGAEEVDGSNITMRMSPPAKPGTAEYKAYTAQQKVESRAWHQAHPEYAEADDEQMTVPVG